MLFWVVSEIGRGIGVLNGVEIIEGEVLGVNVEHPHCNQWGLCGILILCHEGWRCGFSQVTLGFLVILIIMISIIGLDASGYINGSNSTYCR